MDPHATQGGELVGHRRAMPAVRWGAVFAGTIAGVASYMLLGLFGIAVGLTAVAPAGEEPAQGVPVATGIWTGISMLVASFIGGYVASRMSGLSRRSDGMLHGFIAWGVTTVLFASLATTPIGNVLGGTFSLLGQSMQGAEQTRPQNIDQRMSALISGSEQGGEAGPDNLLRLREYLSAGDRQGAVTYMTSAMGFTEEQASLLVDQMLPWFSAVGATGAQQAPTTTVDVLTAASWWIFVAVLLALVLGVWGGLMGARATSDRTLGDHTDERHYRTY